MSESHFVRIGFYDSIAERQSKSAFLRISLVFDPLMA